MVIKRPSNAIRRYLAWQDETLKCLPEEVWSLPTCFFASWDG
jgi:hypothetical protein